MSRTKTKKRVKKVVKPASKVASNRGRPKKSPFEKKLSKVAAGLNDLAAFCHEANKKWWHSLRTGKRLKRNKGELIALMHSELSEALEGARKDSQDDKIPDFKAEPVELADCIIRIMDYAAGFGLDIKSALIAKMIYNRTRTDHQPSERKKKGGKKF